MSGIEVAGLAFGVLPILVEVVRSYKDVSKRMRTLRHHSKGVKSISEQLKVHNGIFLNEIRLLLRSIEAEEEVEVMLGDAADQRWTSKHLDDRLRTALRESFETCCSIIEETRDTIESMRKEMGKFDILLNQRIKGESFKVTLKRLEGAVRISLDRRRYDECLDSLRDRNGDLRALRSQIGAFQRYAYDAKTCIQHRPLPAGVSSIRNASQKLHEALCNAWCCNDPAHRGHYAKLCVDANLEAEAQVRLDLAISCHEPSTNAISSSPPIWIQVESMSTSKNLMRRNETTAQLSPISPPPSTVGPLTSCAVNILKNKAISDVQPQTSGRKKVKRVHFRDASSKPPAAQCVQSQSVQTPPPDVDLCQTRDICEYLQSHLRTTAQKAAQQCIGYLDTPQLYRHSFYFGKHTEVAIPVPDGSQLDNVYSLCDVMRRDPDDVLVVEDQLRLAHKTATALLQYNGTPWLLDRWRLRDLRYFGSQDTLSNAALRTLHLSSQISMPKGPATLTHHMDDVKHTVHTVSEQVQYGINNTTLFFLGVALLEIAHWKPIEEKMIARDLDNEIFAARRLAAGRAPLGPQYQKIAEKCLQCNFGFGTSLSSKSLQTAVYNDVVCELEAMIEKLAI